MTKTSKVNDSLVPSKAILERRVILSAEMDEATALSRSKMTAIEQTSALKAAYAYRKFSDHFHYRLKVIHAILFDPPPSSNVGLNHQTM